MLCDVEYITNSRVFPVVYIRAFDLALAGTYLVRSAPPVAMATNVTKMLFIINPRVINRVEIVRKFFIKIENNHGQIRRVGEGFLDDRYTNRTDPIISLDLLGYNRNQYELFRAINWTQGKKIIWEKIVKSAGNVPWIYDSYVLLWSCKKRPG